MRFLFVLLFLSSSAFAEEEHLFGQWTAAFINGKFGKDSPWTYMFEANIRSQQYPQSFKKTGYDIGSAPIRLGFGYNFDKENSVMIGYLYQYSQPPSAKSDVNENRAWQQFMNIQDFKEDGKLQLRTRFEQRTLEEGYGTALRFRQQIKYSYPIAKEWGLAISEEAFVNCNTVAWGPVQGFDQNRLFIGPYFQLNNETKIEIGYQNVYIDKDLVNDQMNHLIGFNLYYNVPD